MSNAAVAAEPTTRTVALWGATQVGKTTTLAAYFGKHRPAWVVRDDSDTRMSLRSFQEIWNALQGNRLVPGTTMAIDHRLRHREGFTVLFRDMHGGNARNVLTSREDAEALYRADAAMMFIDWPGTNAVAGRAAIENALQELDPDRPTVLLITKCESHLSMADFALFAMDPLEFAQRQDFSRELRESMESFTRHFRQGAVFPVTVYGWNGTRPAHFYDEFGRLVPWHIQPALVERPFEHILGKLGQRKEVTP
ncbi:MAG TPA: hypothetical protein VF017_18520 [Thermoanaerobaculia bacterium]|nr:hypothetical protein [Thermoanaerobaculia bacterium]